MSLQYGLLRSSLLASIQHGFIQSSLFIYLQSNTAHTFTLLSLWNIFLQCLYGNISTIIHIQIQPKIYSYDHLYKDISTTTPIHTKPEISKLQKSSRSSIQQYIKYFHKLIDYYIIYYEQRQVIGYIMSIKRKQRTKTKAQSPEQDKFHLMFNNVLPSDSDRLCTNTHKGCCLLNANKYNYKLRDAIG